MNLRDLDYFVAIASHNQVKLAAEHIGITQPALTKSLMRLERDVGTQLFHRTATGMQLTQAGDLLLKRAQGILLNVQDAERELTDAAAGRHGHLRIGAGPSLTESLLPHVASTLLVNSADVTLKIVTALNDALFSELRAGRLDFVISGIPEHPPEDFEQELLFHDAIVFVTSKSHELAKRNTVRFRDLAKHNWVLPPQHALARRWLEREFNTRNLAAPTPTAEADSAAAIMTIVANTDLIGFQPRSNLNALSVGRRVRELTVATGHWRRPVGVTFRKNEYLPPVANIFLKTLRESVKLLPNTGIAGSS
jgi:DNA-binding transcriptional LysR family regulator